MRTIKFNSDAVVLRSCLELMLSMKEHTTTDREIISRKICIQKPTNYSLKAIRITETWLVDPFSEQVKLAEHVAKIIEHKSQIRVLKPTPKCLKRLKVARLDFFGGIPLKFEH